MYQIMSYRPEFKGQIARLQQYLWRGDDALNSAYLEWKYEQNPYAPASFLCLALHQGHVVGMRGMFGSCWEIGSTTKCFVVPCADDFVIAPAHRHSGLFNQIVDASVAELAARGHPLTFSLSPGVVTVAGSLARGWRAVGSVREVSRVAGQTSWPRRLASRARSWPGGRHVVDVAANVVRHVRREPFRYIDRLARRRPAGGAVWYTREPRLEAMAQLVRRLGHDGRVRHVRDVRYLAWRFANPLHEYRFLFAGDDSLEGYLVLQTDRLIAPSRVNIVDWEAVSPAVRRALLRAATDWGRFTDLRTWTMSLPAEAEVLLGECGFRPVARHPLLPQGTTILLRSVTPTSGEPEPALGDRRLLDASNWDMRMLYSMAG